MWSCKVSTPALRNTVVTSNLPRRKRTIRFRCTWLVTWGQSQPHRDSDETLRCRRQSRTTPSNGPPYVSEWLRGNRAERLHRHTYATHQHIDARKPFVKLTIPERNSTGSVARPSSSATASQILICHTATAEAGGAAGEGVVVCDLVANDCLSKHSSSCVDSIRLCQSSCRSWRLPEFVLVNINITCLICAVSVLDCACIEKRKICWN